MFLLGRTLKLKGYIAFIMGLTYMFSGFMVGTSQVLVLIIAAAWFPVSINYLIKALEKPSFNRVFLLSVINFLLLTGSYPAMTLILFYAYLFVAIYFIYKSVIGGYTIKKVIKVFGGVSVITLLLSGAYLISIAEVLPFMTRAEAIPYTADLFAKVSFNIQCWLSFILPYATISNTEFFNTDLSMANAYIGIIGLVIIISSAILSKDKKIILLLSVAFGFLLLALGMQLPVHYLFYKFIPGFDLFRHPAIFRIYAIFFLIIAMGYGLNYLSENPLKKDRFLVILKWALFFFGGLIISSSLKTNYTLVDDYFTDLLHLREKSVLNLSGHILIQSVIQFGLLLSAYFIIRKKGFVSRQLLVLIFIDLFLAIQLNAPRTIYYNIPFSEFQSYYAGMPEGLSNQDLTDKMENINNKNVSPKQRGLYENLNSYAKRTAYDGYNPFKFKDFIELRKSGLMPSILANPLFYIADSLSSYSAEVPSTITSGKAYLSEDDFKTFRYLKTRGKLSNLQIGYNNFRIDSQFSADGMLFLNQNFNPNWEAYINGERTEILKANVALMAFEVPKGKHSIEIKYENQIVEIAFYISMLTFFLGAIISLIIVYTRKL